MNFEWFETKGVFLCRIINTSAPQLVEPETYDVYETPQQSWEAKPQQSWEVNCIRNMRSFVHDIHQNISGRPSHGVF
jgi:hypothetical protein